MKVQVVTKAGCPRCLLLKDKLDRLKVGYEEVSEEALTHVVNHEEAFKMNYPIVIIEHTAHDYPQAMKKLKEMQNGD